MFGEPNSNKHKKKRWDEIPNPNPTAKLLLIENKVQRWPLSEHKQLIMRKPVNKGRTKDNTNIAILHSF